MRRSDVRGALMTWRPNWSVLFGFLALTLTPFVAADEAYAANFYVDASCAVDGNGRADQCATSPGGAGAWNGTVSGASGGVQNCFNTLVAGDTCFIKNGTYRTTWNTGDVRLGGGFHPMNSGTATSKITYRNYPGHRPVLINCTDGTQVECSHQTISANGQGHIIYDGLTVVGSFYLINSAMSTRPIEIRNCDISVGWFGDGNWSGIYSENWTGNWFHHNLVHHIRPAPNAIQSGAGIKLYSSVSSIVEFNTIENFDHSRVAGLDDKQDSQNSMFRYNYFHNLASEGIRINNQNRFFPSVRGTKVYGNIFHTTGAGVTLVLNITDFEIYNNVFYDVGHAIGAATGSVTGVRIYNNITSVVNRGENLNLSLYGGTVPAMSDYNVWQSAKGYRVGSGIHSSLSTYRSAHPSLEANSREIGCMFVSADDFHLQSTSPCRNTGRVGGTSSGSPVDLGAYAVTACVGHLCGGGGVPPPTQLRPPTNVRILR